MFICDLVRIGCLCVADGEEKSRKSVYEDWCVLFVNQLWCSGPLTRFNDRRSLSPRAEDDNVPIPSNAVRLVLTR